jgi:hypothetical protein
MTGQQSEVGEGPGSALRPSLFISGPPEWPVDDRSRQAPLGVSDYSSGAPLVPPSLGNPANTPGLNMVTASILLTREAIWIEPS